MIFESHAHYDDEAFDEDRDILLSSMRDNGIEYIINVGASLQSTRTTMELTRQYPFIYGAAGVHPSETAEPDHDIQKKWFIRQLELAGNCKKPVIIHSREAAKDTYDIMTAQHAEEIGGVIHCYSYSAEMALDYIKMGFYIGIGGVVTFKNGKKMKEVVQAIPIEKILLETDSPYLAPEPNRGKRNSSLNIPYIAQQIAQLKGLKFEEVVQITNQNAKQLFGIS